jgi:uncharacterized membrane protein YhaH (DUF805 family)
MLTNWQCCSLVVLADMALVARRLKDLERKSCLGLVMKLSGLGLSPETKVL